jgi:hypothetical protein
LLLAWIDALPGPFWLFDLALFVVLSIAGVLARWAGGAFPVGVVDPNAILEGSFVAVFLFIYQGLNGIALRSLSRVRSVMTVDDEELAALADDLIRTPPLAALLSIPIGAISTGLSIASNPVGYAVPEGVGPIMVVWEYTLNVLSSAVIFAFLFHTVHQLRVVTRIHRDLVHVDLFRLEPLYEMANLTAWTGIAIFAAMAYGIGSLYVISAVQFSPVDAAVFIGFIVLAIASFVVPLVGLHGRIADEKARQRVLAGTALETAVAEVEARISRADYREMSALNDGLTAATSAFATISRVSTWPWRPDTLRGFVGALGLPVLIYAITAILSRFL